MTCGGIGSVESIADLSAFGVGFDGEIKSGVIESPVDGKSGVADIVLHASAVEAIRCWIGVVTQSYSIWIDSIGVAGELGGVGIEFRKNDDSGKALLGQGQIFTTGPEAEVGVEFVSFISAAFAGCEYDEVVVFSKSGCGEAPLGEIVWIISQIVIVQDSGGGTGIMNLNPIGGITVFVEE